MSQMRTHQLEERKREEQVGELGNVAHHKQGLTSCRGGRGRSGLVNQTILPPFAVEDEYVIRKKLQVYVIYIALHRSIHQET